MGEKVMIMVYDSINASCQEFKLFYVSVVCFAAVFEHKKCTDSGIKTKMWVLFKRKKAQ